MDSQPTDRPRSSAKEKGGKEKRNHQALTTQFIHEKEKLVARYRRKRDDLNSRGVFDTDINTIRAENMLLAAIGRINISALSKAVQVSKQGKAGGQEESHRKGDQINKAVQLEAELNKRYDDHVNEIENREEERRRQNRAQYLKKGVPGKKKQTILSPSAAGLNVRRPSKTQLTGVPPLGSPGRQFSSSLGDDAKQQGKERRTDDAGQAAEETPSTPKPSSPVPGILSPPSLPRSPPPLESPPMPVAQSPTKQKLEPLPREAEKPQLQYTPSAWLQKQWEHQHYPQVEARLRLQARHRDNMTRPLDPVSRYTEPRQWMTSASKEGAGRAKEEGGGLARRDSYSNIPNLQQGGQMAWSRNAAILGCDRMVNSPSLLELVDGRLQTKTAPKEAPRKVGDAEGRKKKEVRATSPSETVMPFMQSLPHHSRVILQPNFKGKEDLRSEHRKATERELQEQHASVNSNLQVFHVEEPPLFTEDSSDEDEQRREDTRTKAEILAANQELEHIRAESRTVELLEHLVTFLCKEYATRRLGKGIRVTTIQPVRNLLIQALSALQRTVLQYRKEGDARGRGIDIQSSKPELSSHLVAVVRSWSKGVEVLLTWDLSLSEPFTTSKPDHLERLSKYYALILLRVSKRVSLLMKKWRENKARVAADPNHDDPSESSREVSSQSAKTGDIATSLARIAVDQRHPELAKKVKSFMVQYGFVPCGPAGSGTLPEDGSSALLQKIRSMLLNVPHDELNSKGILDRVRQDRSHGILHCGNIFAGVGGSKAARFRVVSPGGAIWYRKRDVETMLNYTANPELMKRAPPLACGTSISVLHSDAEWVQGSNGFWLLRVNPEDNSPILVEEGAPQPSRERGFGEDDAGQVLMHSADNPSMASVVGDKEARIRQRAILLNDLTGVIKTYLKLCSLPVQEACFSMIEDFTRKPTVLEEEAGLRQLVDLSNEDIAGFEGTTKEAPAVPGSSADQLVEAQIHQIERDMLLRKYGGHRKGLQEKYKEVIDHPSMWSTETTGAAPKRQSETEAAEEDVAVLLERRRKEAESRAESRKGAPAKVVSVGKGRHPHPPPGARKANPERETRVDEEDPMLHSGRLGGSSDATLSASELVLSSSDEEETTQTKEDEVLTQKQLLGMLESVWSSLSMDYQLTSSLKVKYSSLSTTVLRARHALWRKAQTAMLEADKWATSLMAQLTAHPGAIDNQSEITNAVRELSALHKAVDAAGTKLLKKTGELLTMNGIHFKEKIRQDSEMLYKALNAAKTSPDKSP